MSPANADPSHEAADQAAALAVDPENFAVLWPLLRHPQPLVRMQAAIAAEQASRACPDLLASYRAELLGCCLDDCAPEVGRRFLTMAVRLDLDADEAARLMRRLEDAVINHCDPDVRADAVDAACALAAVHRRLLLRARTLVKSIGEPG